MSEAYGDRRVAVFTDDDNAMRALALHGIAAAMMTMDGAHGINLRPIDPSELYRPAPAKKAPTEHKHAREIARRLRQEARKAAKAS